MDNKDLCLVQTEKLNADFHLFLLRYLCSLLYHNFTSRHSVNVFDIYSCTVAVTELVVWQAQTQIDTFVLGVWGASTESLANFQIWGLNRIFNKNEEVQSNDSSVSFDLFASHMFCGWFWGHLKTSGSRTKPETWVFNSNLLIPFIPRLSSERTTKSGEAWRVRSVIVIYAWSTEEITLYADKLWKLEFKAWCTWLFRILTLTSWPALLYFLEVFL